jgi:hypothetical protein
MVRALRLFGDHDAIDGRDRRPVRFRQSEVVGPRSLSGRVLAECTSSHTGGRQEHFSRNAPFGRDCMTIVRSIRSAAGCISSPFRTCDDGFAAEDESEDRQEAAAVPEVRGAVSIETVQAVPSRAGMTGRS